eukprot:1302979-Rhodomonas_salina.1
MPGTNTGYCPRVCYAMSGTDTGDMAIPGATGVQSTTESRVRLSAYAFATECPAQRQRDRARHTSPLSSYAIPMRCPVLA